jgi:dTDP-6-deoxy-L-talose 4-dehydrogenase (NAD+)
MKRVLVTGAAGFVGRQVVAALASHDASITAVVRSGAVSRLSLAPAVDRVVVSEDLFSEDESWWERSVEASDIVIHTAWYTNPADYMTSSENSRCAEGTVRMASGVANSGVKRFIGLGTCLEYEQTGNLLTTMTTIRPQGAYASAKADTYLRLSEIFRKTSVEFAWCRLFYLYGEGEREERLVPYLRRQLSQGRVVRLSNPNQVLDFLEVSEVARRIVEVALSDRVGAYNVCSGVATTVRELALRIAKQYGREDLVMESSEITNQVNPAIVGRPSL